MNWVEFYHTHRQRIFSYGGGLLLLVMLGIGYATRGSESAASVHEALARWKASPTDTALETALRTALHKAPALERVLNPEIAQTLLATGRIQEAEELTAPSLTRLSEQAPLHAAFAKTSLLIEKQEYQKALEQAVALKERTPLQSTLYLYNLLRIACLQKQLGNNPGELAAWEELRGLLEHTSDAVALLNANFRKQTFALKDFISLREKQLMAGDS